MIRAVWLALAFAVAGLSPVWAQQGRNPPAEHRVQPYFANLPRCDSPEVLGNLAGSFASREATYWNTGLAIGAFDRVRETAWRPWGGEFVPRRFCVARAYTNDGHRRHVTFFVRETLGWLGNSWEVIWCVSGLDRHRTYAPGCEQATPWN